MHEQHDRLAKPVQAFNGTSLSGGFQVFDCTATLTVHSSLGRGEASWSGSDKPDVDPRLSQPTL